MKLWILKKNDPESVGSFKVDSNKDSNKQENVFYDAKNNCLANDLR